MANFRHTTNDDKASVRPQPVGERYFRPLRIADSTSEWLFWIAASLSFAVLLVDDETLPKLHNLANALFILTVIFVFVLGAVCRLYLSPRAEDWRRKDLFTNSFNVSLTHETTTGYYNNDETNSFRRLSLSVMESSFFTSRICQAMLFQVRAMTIVYISIWLCVVLYRQSDLGLVAAGAQALFSEILLSKWLRLEWLRRRSEEVYDGLRSLLKAARSFNSEQNRAMAVVHVSFYETSKSNAGVVLSNAIFERLNASLSVEWEKVLLTLPRSTTAVGIRSIE